MTNPSNRTQQQNAMQTSPTPLPKPIAAAGIRSYCVVFDFSSSHFQRNGLSILILMVTWKIYDEKK